MDTWEILRHVDHTLLSPTAGWNEIRQVCDDGVKYNVASVCIPPAFVKRAKDYVKDRVKICTVIGFPNGYATTQGLRRGTPCSAARTNWIWSSTSAN